MSGELPTGGSPHGKTPDEDTVLIDGEIFFDMIQGFKEVHFSGKFIGIAITSVEMQHDGIRWGEGSFLMQPLMEKIQLRELFSPTMKP